MEGASYAAAARFVCSTAPLTAQPLTFEQKRAPEGSLTTEEAEAVAALRALLETALSSPSEQREGVEGTTDEWTSSARSEAEAHMDDFTLLRFVKARPTSVSDALEMFRDAMLWRSSHKINELFHELHAARTPETDRQRDVRAYFYGGYGGIDRAGAPYFVLRVGQADYAGFAREPTLCELMVEADAVSMETIFRAVRAGSAATGQFVRARIIVDARNFALSSLLHVGLIKRIMKIGPQVFPEGASKVLIVNAPRLFAAAWSTVAPFLPQRSRDKVEGILSESETLAALLERIAPEELPPFLGGARPLDNVFVARAEQVPREWSARRSAQTCTAAVTVESCTVTVVD